MTKKTIKNIIFDFGNVLLNINYALTDRSLNTLLALTPNDKEKIAKLKKYTLKYEVGTITTENFIWNVQRLSNGAIPQGQDVINAWNAMLIGWDNTKFDLLDKLKTQYHLYLLSNTNEIHITWAMRDLKRNHNIVDFEDRFFKKVYYSHLINLRKPESEIYEFVMEDANLIPNETLFIDDLLENTSMASSLGWNVIHHDPKNDLGTVIQDWILNNT